MAQKAAEKLRELTVSSQYRRFYKLMRKAADENRSHLLVLNMNDATRQILDAGGFTIESVKHLEYDQFKISW